MGKSTTILLVEDNPLLLTMFCDILQVFHPEWQVLTAMNGLEGIQIAQGIQPDLILLDFHLPVMNGYEMALLLQAKPETSQIPLVLHTSEDQDHPLVQRLKKMCQAMLGQPFSLHDLEHTLRHILRNGLKNRYDISTPDRFLKTCQI
ncbi:MAG: response regulator [Caldilineaceae bacterium]|nr:response regulator [Caldilineaceae bacterium]